MPVQVINPGDVKGSFFGGVPYNVSWSFNGGESPSTLSIDVINEAGTYDIKNTNLSYINKVSIGIGAFNFNGYLVSYEIEKTATQKVLHLQYVDLSADLDRYYVGLNGRHAAGTNIILVGKPYHPCDTSRNSLVQSLGQSTIDPCDPCPYMPSNKYGSSCSQNADKFKIWPVYYTFNELLGSIPVSKGTVQNADTNFKGNHTGSLRSVLSAWCSDLGLSFYWDPFNSQLSFISRQSPLSITVNPDSIQYATEIRVGASKQSTFSRGFIGYFSKDGEIKSYDCTTNEDSSSLVTLAPLGLQDLYTASELNDDSRQGAQSTITARWIAACLSKYGKSVKDMWAWFNYYGATSSSAAKSLIGRSLFHMGGLKPLAIYSSTLNSANFQICRELLTVSDRATLDAEDAANGRSTSNPSYYFMVASVDDSYADSQFDSMRNIGENFLGKYFYTYKNVPIPGASNDSRSQIQIEAPDGNGEWYYAGQELKALPLFSFGHTAGSNIGNLARQMGQNNNQITSNSNSAKTTNSIILLERSPKWTPAPDRIQYYQSLFSWYEEHTPKKFGSNGRPDILNSLYTAAQNDSSIKLFICREYYGGSFPVTLSTASHSLEPSQLKSKIVNEQDIYGNTVNREVCRYGLTNNTTYTIKMGDGSKGTFLIETPVGSWYQNTYSVFTKASTNFKKVLPKIQQSEIISAPGLDAAKIDYQFKEISEDNLNILRGNNSDCVPSKAKIKSYILDIGKNSSYGMTNAINKCSFKVPGAMPLGYGILDGLSSVQISVGENGIFTSYSFEDKVTQPPGEEYMMQNLRDKTERKNSLAGYNITTQNIDMVGRSKI